MERIVIRASDANASDLAYVEVVAFEDGPGEPAEKGALAGDLYSDGTFFVGRIETEAEWRRQGVALRSLSYAIRVLRVSVIQASTVDHVADALFAKAGELHPGVRFEID